MPLFRPSQRPEGFTVEGSGAYFPIVAQERRHVQASQLHVPYLR